MEETEFTEDEITEMHERYVKPLIASIEEKIRLCQDIGPLGDLIQLNFSNRNLGQSFSISYNEFVRQANEFDREQVEYMKSIGVI
jgi:hypothetical protein